jgi:hypothetical protein
MLRDGQTNPAKPEGRNSQVAEKVLFGLMLSFLRKQESILFNASWTPVFAGVTMNRGFSASC